MKLFCTAIFLFSSFGFSQEVAVFGRTKICIGETAHLVIVNSPDSINVWYYVDDTFTLIDTANAIDFSPTENTNVAVVHSTDTIYQTVLVFDNGCDCKIFIPNHFTPDGDDRNQFFQPIFNCDLQAVNTFIYDRYGKTVFFSNELHPMWEGLHYLTGETQEDGLYAYQIFYVNKLGETKEIIGHVTLLR